MNVWVRILLPVTMMGLVGLGSGFSAYGGDVIKPVLKGQEKKYRKAGDPEPSQPAARDGEEAEEAVEEFAPPRRGPHDDLSDRYGRRIDPSEISEDRLGRQGGRYDGRDGRYRRPDGRFDGQDPRLDGRDLPPGVRDNESDPFFYGHYDKAPAPRQRIQDRRLESHFKNHYRYSRYYRQAYRNSSSGRFRHFNNSRYRSGVIPGEPRGYRFSHPLPYRYR